FVALYVLILAIMGPLLASRSGRLLRALGIGRRERRFEPATRESIDPPGGADGADHADEPGLKT
ncbi:MAG: cation/H(+) antiporter, partial [Actinomycetota bacterium]|nr:cation/H(+) antiporter [Actinomycetota bacterium]